MTVTKSEAFLLLLLVFFPTPILMSSHEICQCWVLTTKDDYINTERREVLGKYWRVKDSNETAQEMYHRKKFKNDEGYTLWYDTSPEWAVYKNVFTDPPMTQQGRFIQTGCEEEVLDECKSFNYTYYHPSNRDVEDSSMSLTCVDNYCVDTAGDHECKTFVDKNLCSSGYAKQHCRKSCEHCKDQVECTWAEWGTWTYEPCGNGNHPQEVTGIRHRKHENPGSGAPCPGEAQETGTLQCPEHCQLNEWGKWGEWANQQQSCGDRTRTKTIKKKEANGGYSCGVRFSCASETVNSVCTSETEPTTCPGEFEFEKRTESVVSNVGFIDIKVLRKNGNNGTVTVTIQAFEDTATQTLDFTLDDNSVEFADKETEKTFPMKIFENNKTICNQATEYWVDLTKASGKGLIASAPKNTITVSITQPQDIGCVTPEGSSLISLEVAWLIVLSVGIIIVIVLLVMVIFFIFPKRSNLRKDYPKNNKSYTALNMKETTEIRNDTVVENFSSGLLIAPNMRNFSENPSAVFLASSEKVNGDIRKPLPRVFLDLPTPGESKINPASPKVAELKKNFEQKK